MTKNESIISVTILRDKSKEIEEALKGHQEAIEQHQKSISSLQSQKVHIDWLLEHADDFLSKGMPAPKRKKPTQGLTSIDERKKFVVDFLRRLGREATNEEIYQRQIGAGIKTTKLAHDAVLSKMRRDPREPIVSGEKYGTYKYQDPKA